MKRVLVSVTPEEAFTLFTRDMGAWWPLGTHSIAADTHEGKVTVAGLVFDEKQGGHIHETMTDGSEGTWGRVLAWDPPHRVVFSWKPNLSDDPETEIEVSFEASDGGTEVTLEHRGWDRLRHGAEDKRTGYDVGWPGVLELYRSAADRGRPA